MKKIIAVLSLALVCLSGCGKQANELVVGTNATFPPFEYMGGTGGDEVKGFDIDIARQIAKDAGKTLRVENMNFDALIVALNSGKIDMIAAGMTITPEREKTVSFSTPYYEATQVVITRKDDNRITQISDLKDKKIAVQLGTTGDVMAKDFSQQVVAFNSGFEALMELKNGRVDLVLFDSAPAAHHLAKNPQLKMQQMDFKPEYYGLAMAKGNDALVQQVDASLAKMQADGQLDSLLDKYMK